MVRGRRNNLPNIGRPRFVQIRDTLRRRPRLFYKIIDQGRTVEEDSSSRKSAEGHYVRAGIEGRWWTKAEFAACHNIDERSLDGIHVCDDNCPGDDLAQIQAVGDQFRKIRDDQVCRRSSNAHTRPTDDGSDHYIERKKNTPLSLDEEVDDDHLPGIRIPRAILDRVYRNYLSGKGSGCLCDSPSSK